MNNFLRNILDSSDEYAMITDAIKKGKKSILISGLLENQRIELVDFLNRNIGRHVVITHNDGEAKKVYNSLVKKGIDAVIVESEEIRFYSVEAKDRTLEANLVNNLFKLSKEDYEVAVISADSLIKKYTPKSVMKLHSYDLKLGEVLDKDLFIDKLINMGYVREHKVEGVGQFSIRGGIIDIFTPNFENPIRIELFDDEIDSIRPFDIFTQKSVDKIKYVKVLPARSFLYPDNIEEAANLIEKDIKKDTSEDIVYDLERIRNRIYFEGVSKYIDYFYGENTIFDYIKNVDFFVINDPNRTYDKLENIFQEFSDNYQSALEKGFAIKREGNLLLPPSYVIEKLKEYRLILNTTLTSTIKNFSTDEIVDIETREAKVFHGKIYDFINEVKYLRSMTIM